MPCAGARGRAVAYARHWTGRLSAMAPVAAAYRRCRAGCGIHPRLSARGAARRDAGRLGPALRRRTQGRPMDHGNSEGYFQKGPKRT